MKNPLQATRDPSVLDSAGEIIEAGAERARDALGTFAERTQDAIDAAEIDPNAVRAGAARALAAATDREVQCEPAIEAAEDRLRLKTALIAGVVAFVLSALVLLAARKIALRSRERGSQRHESEPTGPRRPDVDPED